MLLPLLSRQPSIVQYMIVKSLCRGPQFLSVKHFRAKPAEDRRISAEMRTPFLFKVPH